MEPITPAYGAGPLLLIAAGAIAVLLVLIIHFRLHAFVALVLVSALTALVAGIPVGQVPAALSSGFSSTLGSVALLVGFGVMLGRILEVSGGAQVLADSLISRFGEKRAPFALGVAALLFGFPIFFDAGLVVFLPIILAVARRFGGSVLYYAIPAAGAFAAMHALLPPHPGPVAAATEFSADIGLTLLLGAVAAVISWYVGVYLVSKVLGRRFHVPLPSLLLGEERGRDGLTEAERQNGAPGRTPGFGLVLGLLLLPMVLIAGKTVSNTLVSGGTLEEESPLVGVLTFLGDTPIALLITLLAAILLIRVGGGKDGLQKLLDDSLAPICSIILITGAGGMFGGVLRASGIGEALTTSLGGLGLSLILQAFLISTLLRVAQGSATVALTTTAGLLAAAVGSADLSSVQLVALVIAIAAGATVLSHVNDSGFWLVGRFFEMDTKTTLRTWTVMETTLGLAAFGVALVLWWIGGVLA